MDRWRIAPCGIDQNINFVQATIPCDHAASINAIDILDDQINVLALNGSKKISRHHHALAHRQEGRRQLASQLRVRDPGKIPAAQPCEQPALPARLDNCPSKRSLKGCAIEKIIQLGQAGNPAQQASLEQRVTSIWQRKNPLGGTLKNCEL